jgi:phosphoribosylaminoimidazole-succinocarboxamide synthase
VTLSVTSQSLQYRHVYGGKVRDTYEITPDLLLIVASDRISAFDVVLPSTVPDKGVILTQLSHFWFEQLSDVVPNHLAEYNVVLPDDLRSRSMVVRKADRIPVECVVRGYISGSGWVEYQRSGAVAGHALPQELRQSDKLPEPIFTPARKNDIGHDENIPVQLLRNEIGVELSQRLEQISLGLYNRAHAQAIERGVIIADTKFEFGWIDGEVRLIDEALTPDSSRFWEAALWSPGGDQPSFDKQFVRDWLLQSGWDREPPGPELPFEVIAGTRDRYLEAFRRLTGESLEIWQSRRQSEVSA